MNERERQLRAALFAVMLEFDKTFDRETAIAEALVAERKRVRQMEEALRDREELIRWTAQSVHQAYHQHKAGTFRECSMSICRAATDALDATEPSSATAEEGEA